MTQWVKNLLVMQEIQETSIPASGRSLEEEMAAHSSFLAWRIPWTEEPGGLQSKGPQRVRQDGTHSTRGATKIHNIHISAWSFSLRVHCISKC